MFLSLKLSRWSRSWRAAKHTRFPGLHSRGLQIASEVELGLCSSNTMKRFAMRVSSFVAAVAVLFAVASVAEAQSTPPPAASCNLPHASGVQQRQLMSGGRERSYRLFVPPRYNGRTPLP